MEPLPDYDLLGRLTSITDATNRTTSVVYDELARVTSVTAPGSRTTTFSYDGGAFLLLSRTNAANETDTFAYDNAGQMVSHTDALNRTVLFGYDPAGNQTSITDGNGHVTTYSYNDRDELSGIAYPDSTGESYAYLATGQLWQRTDGRGVTVARAYDDAGRLTLVDYPAGMDTTFSFDADGRKTAMSDATGTTTYTSDDAGRLTSRIAPQGSVSFGYDSADRLIARTLSGAGVTTFSYDDADRLVQSTAPGSGGTTSYAYDDANRLAQTTFGNGAVETMSYNTAGDLSDNWHQASPGGDTIRRHTYSYDSVGRRINEALQDGTQITFGYDTAGQLTSEARTGGYSTGYSYDNAGNRLTKTLDGQTESYTYDDANKLLSAGAKTYGYDLAGNVASVTQNGQTTSLTWDDDSRLAEIAYPGGGTNQFVYNGLDQRVGKTDSTGTFSYTLEDDAIDSPVLGDGAATYNQVMGLVSELRGGASSFYHSDALSSTRALTNANGQITDTKESDAFGNVWTPGTSGSTPTPFGFAGGWGYQSDADSGLMRLGYRYYDASVGRFLSRDPIQAGYNWYTYCDNDPVNSVDPEGLKQMSMDSLRAYLINLWRSYKDPRTIIREIELLIENGMGSSMRRLQEAKRFYEEFERNMPRIKQIIDHAKAKNWTPPKDLDGGTFFRNLDGKLPKKGVYRKYDLFPKGPKRRGSERIVIDELTGRSWYSPDHYQTFYQIPH